jgi:hypothetical protein
MDKAIEKVIREYRYKIDDDAKGIYIGEGRNKWEETQDKELSSAITKLFKQEMLRLIDFNINEMGEYFSRRIGEIVSCKYCMPSDNKRRFLLKEFLEEMEMLRAELRKKVDLVRERAEAFLTALNAEGGVDDRTSKKIYH